MQKKGHRILFTCREKEFEIDLINNYSFDYKSFGRKFNSKTGKLFGLLKFDIQAIVSALKFKPDILLSHGSIYAAHASVLLRKPHISLEDTFNTEQVRLYLPFTKVVLTGDYEHPDLGDKEIRYNGYHELAYLHPNHFTPDKNILNELNITANEKFVIIRFVAWNATHDTGHKGISYKNKLKAIKEFEKYARVFISSESELPDELKKYKMNIPPHRMHDALAFASLLFGESATMASECSMLGIPSIFIDNTGRFYTLNLEKKYGLCFNYSESNEDQLKAIEKGVEILQTSNIKQQWQEKRKRMLEDKIDVTAFMFWFVENYPESVKVMRANPEYQYKFK
ncbi:MAG: DUF354 domain-containing protein [Marinilabiliales bacterium]